MTSATFGPWQRESPGLVDGVQGVRPLSDVGLAPTIASVRRLATDVRPRRHQRHLLPPHHPSYHYRRRSGRSIQTVKATVLDDSHTQAVLDVQPSTKWRHDSAVGPQVARRNASDFQSLAAGKDYDDNSFRASCAAGRPPAGETPPCMRRTTMPTTSA